MAKIPALSSSTRITGGGEAHPAIAVIANTKAISRALMFRRLTDRGSAAAAPRSSEYQSGGRRASTAGPVVAGHATLQTNQSGAAGSCNRLLGSRAQGWEPLMGTSGRREHLETTHTDMARPPEYRPER